MNGEKVMRRNLLFSLLGSAIVCLGLAGVSQAVPQAFVSTAGSDTNPCSAAQPCRSFNQALNVLDPGGEIVVKDSGGYSNGFTITRSVTIDAAGFNASVTTTSGIDGCDIVTGPSDRVVLRGISFHGANVGGNAIVALQVGSLYVERCSITEFTGDAVLLPHGGSLWVTNTAVRSCLNGLRVLATDTTPAFLFAQDSLFTECHGTGVTVDSPGLSFAQGFVNNCTASTCFTGFKAVSESSIGASLTAINCRALNAAISGFSAISSGKGGTAALIISNCVALGSASGISTSTSGGGIAQVAGTSPGTNLIYGNGIDGSTTYSVTLQ
jgi:hypothetical protein